MLVRIVGLTLMLFSSFAWANEAILCLKIVKISVRQRSPEPAHFSDDSNRKMTLVLRMNTDCKTGTILIPSSFIKAKDWLDLALPYDFKIGITGGTMLNAYVYTPYGFSAEDDLYAYFTKQWKLGPNSPICKNAPPDPDVEEEGNTCFYKIINSIRSEYKTPTEFVH